MKYRIYIDEVGNSDMGSSENFNHRYLSLTGVIFDLDYVSNVLSPEIEELKKRFFGSHPDEPIILHRKEIINKRFPFTALNNPTIEGEFNRVLLDKLKNWDYTVISVVIDKLEHMQQYSVWRYDPYHYCLAIIIERYFSFLKGSKATGDFMIESRGGKEDMRLKASFRKIMEEGTQYKKSDDFNKVFTSKELKVKQKSANISGLQVADLLAYPSRTFMFNVFEIEKRTHRTFNDEIIEILKQKYYRKNEKILGYGIKALP